MFGKQLFRFIHTGCWNASNKTLLSKLRKKTGYPFASCKKALELHDYNFSSAEKWLQEQAQELGWAKATKLEGRLTAQGLVGIAVKENCAAILEVNCETDFVARNKNFSSFVELAVTACLKFSHTLGEETALYQHHLNSSQLKQLVLEDGKSLSDHVALVIGKVGENLVVRRATCFRAVDSISLAGYAHPSPATVDPILLGKFGAVVAFKTDPTWKQEGKLPQLSTDEIGRGLCQHVVGMNPKRVGAPGQDEPAACVDDEECMIYQEYLLDPEQTVGDVLGSSATVLLDFVRYECGEPEPEAETEAAVLAEPASAV